MAASQDAVPRGPSYRRVTCNELIKPPPCDISTDVDKLSSHLINRILGLVRQKELKGASEALQCTYPQRSIFMRLCCDIFYPYPYYLLKDMLGKAFRGGTRAAYRL